MWIIDGQAVETLPAFYTFEGNPYSDLGARDVAFLTQLGIRTAPPYPAFDPATQQAVWNASADEWVIVDLPPIEPAPEVFSDISDRQFFQTLASAPYNLITEQEALDAVKTGEIPAVMQAVINQLPESQRFAVTMLIAGATSFRRDNPVVGIFAASQNMDEAAINAFWRKAMEV